MFEQNGRRFAEESLFKCIILKYSFCVLIQISLNFVLKGLIIKTSVWVKGIAQRWTSDMQVLLPAISGDILWVAQLNIRMIFPDRCNQAVIQIWYLVTWINLFYAQLILSPSCFANYRAFISINMSLIFNLHYHNILASGWIKIDPFYIDELLMYIRPYRVWITTGQFSESRLQYVTHTFHINIWANGSQTDKPSVLNERIILYIIKGSTLIWKRDFSV